MQIRCYACHMPFSLSKEVISLALDTIHTDGLNHFNAHCPRCRKANRLSREQLLRVIPDWRPPEPEEEKEEL